MNKYKHPSEFKSCDKCKRLINDHRYGCPWRSEIAMFEDKSPCLNYEENGLLHKGEKG